MAMPTTTHQSDSSTPTAPNPAEAAARIGDLLEQVRRTEDPAAADLAEEIVRRLLELYGAGLERIVSVLDDAGPDGAAMLERLTQDQVVASLLLVHDLHPVDVLTRIGRALDGVRPYLGSHAGGIELVGVDDEGVAHLKLEGSCDGCPSSTVTVTLTIERAIFEAAPEITKVDVEGVAAPATDDRTLLQIQRFQGGPAAEDAPVDWTPLELPALANEGLAEVELAGTTMVVVRLEDSHYAYRSACPACAAGLGEAGVTAQILACGHCGARYDVRLAGRPVGGAAGHLDPVPLLDDAEGCRVALPVVGVVAG
jgi:Fe-S cluster biogenesis protein NfuA/nitrite reductase/ring-hydroxylating ferredoxin subunit